MKTRVTQRIGDESARPQPSSGVVVMAAGADAQQCALRHQQNGANEVLLATDRTELLAGEMPEALQKFLASLDTPVSGWHHAHRAGTAGPDGAP
jgi:hypothetical protein